MEIKKSINKSVYQYPVIVQEDVSGGYWVICPSLPGCYSQGDTIDQALENIREAIALCLEDMPKKDRVKQAKQLSLHLVQI